MRKNVSILHQQTNIGIDNISGEWAIYLQADEVLHENSVQLLKAYILANQENKKIDGLLFPYFHFWGDYSYIRNTRETYQYEIRAFRNNGTVRSYKDAQGFRKYVPLSLYDSGETGSKLNVIKIAVPVYHYSYTRNPKTMKSKARIFNRFWHNDEWLKKHVEEVDFDYNNVD